MINMVTFKYDVKKKKTAEYTHIAITTRTLIWTQPFRIKHRFGIEQKQLKHA